MELYNLEFGAFIDGKRTHVTWRQFRDYVTDDVRHSLGLNQPTK